MKRIIILLFLSIFYSFAQAEETTSAVTPIEEIPSPLEKIHSLYAAQASWTFSGMVFNENGENYVYYFHIQKRDKQLQGSALLMASRTKEILIYEESSSLSDKKEDLLWRAGNLFLRFNVINNSWIFGVKGKDKKGFNFKVDMLGQTDAAFAKEQLLRAGLIFLINQTGRLNGHFQLAAGNEEFVTAKTAWFRQIWLSNTQAIRHPLKMILCTFNEGSAFYSVNLPETDAIRAALAGWRNPQGLPEPVSQFTGLEKGEDPLWILHISPKLTLSLKNVLSGLNPNQLLIAGFTEVGLKGFCAINEEEFSAS